MFQLVVFFKDFLPTTLLYVLRIGILQKRERERERELLHNKILPIARKL